MRTQSHAPTPSQRTKPKTITEPRSFTCREDQEEHTTDLHHLSSLLLQPHRAWSKRSAFNISPGGLDSLLPRGWSNIATEVLPYTTCFGE